MLPTPIGQLGYFTLSAPDVARAAAFYTALFGWHFEPPGPGSTGRTYSHVDNTVGARSASTTPWTTRARTTTTGSRTCRR